MTDGGRVAGTTYMLATRLGGLYDPLSKTELL